MAEEKEYCYDFPRAMVTADIVLFGHDKNHLYTLLIRRKQDPYQGKWAFPGGFMDMDETLEHTAVRELEEETGLKGIRLEQMHTFSKTDRDPRGRTVSTAFFGLVNVEDHNPQASDDAEEAHWVRVEFVTDLAFDHNEVFAKAMNFYTEKYSHLHKHLHT